MTSVLGPVSGIHEEPCRGVELQVPVTLGHPASLANLTLMWAILLNENIVIFLVVDHHDPDSRRQVIPVV